jgi:hypothetical protein
VLLYHGGPSLGQLVLYLGIEFCKSTGAVHYHVVTFGMREKYRYPSMIRPVSFLLGCNELTSCEI